MTQSVFKINLSTGDVEISGSEEFVSACIDRLPLVMRELGQDTLMAKAPGKNPTAGNQNGGQDAGNSQGATNSLGVPDSFGEWKQKFKDGLTQDQKVLMSGYYCQAQNPENIFKTKEANDILKNHGIKVANAANNLKSLEENKYVFIAKKSGKLKLYRVTEQGLQHLNAQMMQQNA